MPNPWFETVAEAQRRMKKQLPPSVYGALVAGSEKGLTVRGQHQCFQRAWLRAERGRAVGAP
jgi:hypothetical protein